MDGELATAIVWEHIPLIRDILMYLIITCHTVISAGEEDSEEGLEEDLEWAEEEDLGGKMVVP